MVTFIMCGQKSNLGLSYQNGPHLITVNDVCLFAIAKSFS